MHELIRLITLSGCLLFFFTTQAQFVYEENMDLLMAGRNYGVVPVGHQGVFLFNEVKNLESVSKRRWELLQFDTHFKLLWRSYFESSFNFTLSQVKYVGDHLYLLFKDTSIPARSVSFVRANREANKIEFFEISEFLPGEITGFEVLQESLFLIGVDNDQPAIIRYRFGDPRPRVLQGLFSEYNELLSTEALPDINQIRVISKMRRQRRSKGLILIQHFDENGSTSHKMLIESSKGYNLLDAITALGPDGSTCVVGTYSYNNSKMSNGIFSTVFDEDAENSIYYYDYKSLHNFFDFLPEKDRRKMQKKYQSGSSAKRSYKANLDLRQLSSVQEGWRCIGEVIRIAEKNSRIYGNMWPVEYREYSHALVFGIGKDGRLQWDNSFGMDGLERRLGLQQAYACDVDQGTMLYYYNGDYLVYKLIRQGNSLSENQQFFLGSHGAEFTDGDLTKNGNILPWFDNTFLIFGTYTITPKFGEGSNYFSMDRISIDKNNNFINP